MSATGTASPCMPGLSNSTRTRFGSTTKIGAGTTAPLVAGESVRAGDFVRFSGVASGVAIDAAVSP